MSLFFFKGSGGLPTPECRFKVREVLMQNQFVTIESVAERGRYVAVLPNGQMKSAIATTGADQDTHFAIRLIVRSFFLSFSFFFSFSKF